MMYYKIIKRMYNKGLFVLPLFLLLVLGLYIQLVFLTNQWLGWVLFVLFFVLTSYWWRDILKRVFYFQKRSGVTCVLSIFIVFLFLSFFSSIFVVWYEITPIISWIVYVIVGFFSFGFLQAVKRFRIPRIKYRSRVCKFVILPKSWILVGAYVALWAVSAYFLWQSGSREVLFTPWYGIHEFFLPLFFLATFVLGVILFSKHKTKLVLFLIVAHSVLLHSYLPLSSNMPWGGDVWRTIAVEEKLASGDPVLPVLFGEDVKWRGVGVVSIPEALLIPNKYVYGQLWGVSVLVSHTTSIDILLLNKWLMPILWAVFLPVIFFRIGFLLFGSYRKGLVLSALSLLPFSLQVLGSLTLAVSLGHITFFFVLMLWLHYIRDGKKWQRNVVFGMAALMIFGYTLHFLLLWFLIFVTFFVKKIVHKTTYKMFKSSGNRFFRLVSLTVLFFVSMFFFPVIELVTNVSYVPESFGILKNLKQAVGQFSGWFYASSIRPHDILSGNIFFNHTPQLSFFSSFFTDWRWYILPVISLIWVCVIFGLFRIGKQRRKIEWMIMGVLFFVIVGGYFIGWFVLEGDRSFIRRLDGLFAFIVLVFMIQGMSFVLDRLSFVFKHQKRIAILFIIFLFSFFATTAYSSGPDMRVVSQDEFDAARFVWDTSLSDNEKYCVLGDTWMLLALEAVSFGEIVGGGFPIDYQFGQPERSVLFSEIINHPKRSVITVAHNKTGAELCSIVLPMNLVSFEKRRIITDIFGEAPKQVGSILVWREVLKIGSI